MTSVWDSVRVACLKVHEEGNVAQLDELIRSLKEQAVAPGDDRVAQLLCSTYLGALCISDESLVQRMKKAILETVGLTVRRMNSKLPLQDILDANPTELDSRLGCQGGPDFINTSLGRPTRFKVSAAGDLLTKHLDDHTAALATSRDPDVSCRGAFSVALTVTKNPHANPTVCMSSTIAPPAWLFDFAKQVNDDAKTDLRPGGKREIKYLSSEEECEVELKKRCAEHNSDYKTARSMVKFIARQARRPKTSSTSGETATECSKAFKIEVRNMPMHIPTTHSDRFVFCRTGDEFVDSKEHEGISPWIGESPHDVSAPSNVFDPALNALQRTIKNNNVDSVNSIDDGVELLDAAKKIYNLADDDIARCSWEARAGAASGNYDLSIKDEGALREGEDDFLSFPSSKLAQAMQGRRCMLRDCASTGRIGFDGDDDGTIANDSHKEAVTNIFDGSLSVATQAMIAIFQQYSQDVSATLPSNSADIHVHPIASGAFLRNLNRLKNVTEYTLTQICSLQEKLERRGFHANATPNSANFKRTRREQEGLKRQARAAKRKKPLAKMPHKENSQNTDHTVTAYTASEGNEAESAESSHDYMIIKLLDDHFSARLAENGYQKITVTLDDVYKEILRGHGHRAWHQKALPTLQDFETGLSGLIDHLRSSNIESKGLYRIIPIPGVPVFEIVAETGETETQLPSLPVLPLSEHPPSDQPPPPTTLNSTAAAETSNLGGAAAIRKSTRTRRKRKTLYD